ncbi:MAG TPA: BTAD domain-containing putative transcriptional regulator [Gemmatimonadaceae bacterium]|nr:BTAD domain-containing putative transcriptional regulator [Gemmatimonadaceae bacterium]
MPSADYQPHQVLRLVTLGGLAATDADGAPLATSPPRRRLALLALIAASGDLGISRDKLLFYFWPEGSEERSRHALTQTLYALRRDVGGLEIIAGSSELRLARELITSDIAELNAALEAGRLEQAAELYAGPFLDGVFLPGLPDFERWVEDERARIARRVSGALEALADAAVQAGDAAAAERWNRRLATMDPLNGRYALRLMESLAALGDRAGALRHARVHQALVEEELGGEPDPAVLALAARLREAPTAPAAPAALPPASPEASTAREEPSDAEREGILERPRRWLAMVGGMVVVAAVVGYAAIRTPPVRGALARESDLVLVTDLDNTTGDTVFDRSLPVALSAGLMQTDRVTLFSRARVRETLALMGKQGADTAIDETLGREIAQRAGVRLVVVPSIARFDSTYVLTARVVDASTGEVADIESTRADKRSDVLRALDELSRSLRRRFGETILSLHRRTTPLPLATTSSLEALKLYADGLRAFNTAEYASAITLYRAAIARDSNFAMAHAALGSALYWTNDRPAGEAEFERALSLMDRLSDREKFLVRAQVAGWRGDRAEQITILSAYLLRYPNDVGARSQLGYAYLRARRFEEARDTYLSILATDSTDASDIVNLATAYGGLGQPERAVEAYHRAFAVDPSFETSSTINIEYGSTLVKAGRLDEARATFQKMLALQPAEQARGYRALSYLDTYHGHYTAAAQELAEAILIDRVLGYRLSEARDRLRRSLVVGTLGDEAGARAELDEVWKIFHSSYLEPTMLAWIGKAEARAGKLSRSKELLDSLHARVNAGSRADRAAESLLQGEIAIAEGRFADAQSHIATALKLDSTRYVLESAAYGAERSGNLVEAAQLYTALGKGIEFGWEGQRGWELAPYRLGLVEERLGDSDAAQKAFRAMATRWPDGDPGIPVLADARRRAGITEASR